MPGVSRILFSLHRDPVLIESRDDEDEFLQRLMDDLDVKYVIKPEEGPPEECLPEEGPPEEGPPEVPFVDKEEEDPKEDPIKEEKDPDKDLIQEEEDQEEGPAAGPMGLDEDLLKDPLEESDDESFIDWDAELQHLDDLPPEEEGMWPLNLDEDLVETVPDEAVEEGLEKIEEYPIWDFPEIEVEEEGEQEGPGEPEVVDPIPVEDPWEEEEEEEDVVVEVVQQAQHPVQAAHHGANLFAGMLDAERQVIAYLRTLLEEV